MAKPSRSSNPRDSKGEPRTFFLTTRTAGGRSLFQTDRMANLMIDVLRSYTRAGKFRVHDFVIMRNHIHVLLTVPGDTSVEKAMQLIKGNFSFRAKKELGFTVRSGNEASPMCASVMKGAFATIRSTYLITR